MPDEEQNGADEPQAGTTPPKRQAKAAEPEPRYTADELRDSARSLLDVSPHAVAGALAGDTRENYTIEDARARVEKFLNRKDQTVVDREKAEKEAEA